MPTSYTAKLRLAQPATGELFGTWGTTVNTGITALVEDAIAGRASVAMSDADYTLTSNNGAADEARNMVIRMTGTLTAPRNVICPTAAKLYIFENATTGGFAVTLKTSAGTGVSVAAGASALLRCDGTNVVTWVTASGGTSPGGATTQIQFNNAGAFAGNANFTLNNATGVVTAGKDMLISGVSVGVAGDGSANSLLDTGNVVVGVGSGSDRVGTIKNANELEYLRTYKIVTVGTTDWTLLGAASNTVGVIFQANDDATGTGTGTAYLMASYNTVLGSQAGALMAQAANNVLIGANAAAAAVNGDGAVVIGAGAGESLTYLSDSVVIGNNAMQNASGVGSSVVIGERSAQRGSYVTTTVAVGTLALNEAVGIGGTVAVGFNAMPSYGEDIPAGSFIVGRGYYITFAGTTNFVAIGAADNNVGTNFIATGVGSGTGTASSAGGRCTGVGSNVMELFTDGSDNTAVGCLAHRLMTTGQYNVAIGSFSGRVTTGSNNLELSTENPGGGAGIFNVAANSNRIVMGNNEHTNAYVKVAWTVTSDARDKTSFAAVPHGLDFVQALRPVSYRFRENRGTDVPVGPVRYGFLAQDILALEGANNVVIDAEDAEHLKYTESSMVPILVRAIQELKAELDLLRTQAIG